MAKRKGRTTSTSDQLDRLAAEGLLPIPIDAARELAGRGVLDLDRELIPPLMVTPTPSLDRRSKHYHKGAFFDVDEVCRIVRCLTSLRHTKGRRWAGKPLRPEPWQVLWIIAPVFGWRALSPDGEALRIIRDVWVEVPRKNGKTTLCSGLALILLTADREPGAEVYSAAGSTDQARQVFDPAKQMAITAPKLVGKVRPLASVLQVPKTGGIFRVLSKVAETAHGLNVSGAVIDEIHTLKSPDLVDAIETGTGGREQPLVFLITTSDDGKTTTIYAEKRDDIEALVDDRGDPDHSTFGVIWAAPEDADTFALETAIRANPGYEVTVTKAYLERKCARARRSPAFLHVYERLHLNRRRSAIARALDMDTWTKGCNTPAMSIGELRSMLRDRECLGGLDLATTEDFAAWVLVFPDDELEDADGARGIWVLPRLWVPAAAVDRRKGLAKTLRAWAEEGWVTITDGDVIDFPRIEREIGEDAEAFNVAEFAYDPWQAEYLRQNLLDGGLAGWKCGQTMERLSPATQEIERLLGLGLVRTGGNPALEWMASNVVAKSDSHGRWKPEKSLSAEKIDGFSGMCMAVASLIRPDREIRVPPAMATPPKAAGDDRDFFRPSDRLDL